MSIQWNNEDYLAHYGVPRRSGRYKWGSGKKPFQGLLERKRKPPTEEEINTMIKKGNSKKIIKNFEYFSDQDLSRAVSRVQYKKRLMDMETDSISNGMRKYKQVIDTANGTMDLVNKSVNTVNSGNKLIKKANSKKKRK